ncbi:MAG: hypothetical protein KKH94_02775 [Candidatus Omnitrophica bacterium]|nr:hypothetical protein [Candidatus Omnitrophota bacterium]
MVISRLQELYAYIQNSNDPLIVFAKIALVSLVIFSGLRYVMIGNLFRMIKQVGREVNKSVRRQYFRHSWVGWLFFILGVAVVELLVFRGDFLISFMNFDMWICIATLLFFISIFYHLYFFTESLITIFKQRMEIEKN